MKIEQKTRMTIGGLVLLASIAPSLGEDPAKNLLPRINHPMEEIRSTEGRSRTPAEVLATETEPTIRIELMRMEMVREGRNLRKELPALAPEQRSALLLQQRKREEFWRKQIKAEMNKLALSAGEGATSATVTISTEDHLRTRMIKAEQRKEREAILRRLSSTADVEERRALLTLLRERQQFWNIQMVTEKERLIWSNTPQTSSK